MDVFKIELPVKKKKQAFSGALSQYFRFHPYGKASVNIFFTGKMTGKLFY
jgi:hypothetical protein